MNPILNLIKHDALMTALIISTLTLAAAWSFQMAGYAPCELCWTQRYPYMAIIAVAVVASLFKVRDALWALVLIAGLAIWDASVAIYHTGVEQKWWQGPTTCTGGSFDSSTALSLDTLYTIDAAVVRCDVIPWELFGISMAGFNALIATSLSCYCLYHITQRLRHD